MSKVQEIFVPIKGYEGLYEVSNHGNVKTLAKVMDMPLGHGVKVFPEKIMSKVKTKTGYERVKLSNNGSKKLVSVHRLVAMAFLPNPENKATVNHKDGNKSNNHVDNLEWATTQENEKHAVDNGLKCSGGKHKFAKKVIHITTGIIYQSASEAAKHFNLNYFRLSDSLRGRTKTQFGLKYLVDKTLQEQ